MNKEVLKQISYGLYVISTNDEVKPTGCIANSVIQITYDKLLISLNTSNYTNECIKKSGKFGVSILAETVEPRIFGIFGYKSGRNFDKFKEVKSETIEGIEIIKDSLGYIICNVINAIECETHTVFIGKMTTGDTLREGNPMTYSYYHKILKGTSPKAAPSHVEETIKEEKNMKYKCQMCGYIYEGDISKEPADYACPICGATKDQFEQIEE